MPREQPARAPWRHRRLIPHLAGVANQRAVGVDGLTILEQEVLAARVRPGGTHQKRRVGGRRRAERIRPRRRERRKRHPTELAQRPGIHARRARGRGEVPGAHQTPAADACSAVARVVQIGQAEAMAGLVGHGADRHDVGAGAGVRAAEPALEDVVLHLEELARVVGPRVLGHVPGKERPPMGPQMVLRTAARPALPTERGLHEEDQTDHTAGRVVAERGEIHLRVHECERFAQPGLHWADRRAPDPVTVRRAERILLLARGAGPAIVARLRLAEPHPAGRRALHVEQPVGQLAVEAVIGVGTAERRRGAEQHGIVGSGRKRWSGRARIGEQHGRHSQRARHRSGARDRHPRGEGCVQSRELPLCEQAGSGGAHRAGLPAPDTVRTEIAPRRLAAGPARFLRACRQRRAPREPEGQQHRATWRHAACSGTVREAGGTGTPYPTPRRSRRPCAPSHRAVPAAAPAP